MSEPIFNHRDRVMAMLEEGKISREEADQLLEALGDADEVESTMKAVDEEIKETAARAQEPQSVASSEPSQAKTEKRAEPKVERNNDLNWVVIEMLAGDLNVKVDASLSEPKVLDGKASLEKKGNTYVLHRGKAKVSHSGDPLKDFGNMVAGFIGGLHGDLEIAIPEGFGVEVSSKAGDVDIEGAVFLKANLLAGDLDAKDIAGIDLQMAAGDVDVSLKLTTGSHKIKLAAGDVDIHLLRGSSVQVEGSVSMGDFKIHAPQSIEESLEINNSMMGGDFKATLGGGEAHLEVELSTGDIEVKVEND